jgi:CO/xanthine dehydrogenase Mo-binding subunit
VRKGNFTAIVAENEWSAIVGMRQLQAAGWHRTAAPLPTAPTDAILQSLEFEDVAVEKVAGTAGAPVRSLKARYSRPWLMHGSIGPSCAVAWLDGGMMTVWTHSQGVYPLRKALAELLHMTPDKVRCIHVQGAGCYGHNGADDVAADAALVALAMPGRPIRLQWMREQEHGWEPLGPGMLVELEASLDADQRIVAWKHAVWSNGHNDRPVTAGGLLAGGEVDPPFPAQRQRPIPMPEGGGDRNSNPLYAFPNIDVVYHFLPHAPLRVSALRSLGAQMNIFAIESFMDELARAASSDPVAFRLAHMRDPRARDVITMAAERFGWTNRPKPDGRAGAGFAFARYKNLGAYCALARLRGLGQFLISRFKEINTLT